MAVLLFVFILSTLFIQIVSNILPLTAHDHLKCALGRLRGSTTECNPQYAEATCPSHFVCSGGPNGEGGPCCVKTNPCNQGQPLVIDGEAVTCDDTRPCHTGYSCLTGRNNSFSVCCPGIYPRSMYFISTNNDMLNPDMALEEKILSFVETSAVPKDEDLHSRGGLPSLEIKSGLAPFKGQLTHGDNLIKPRLPGEEFMRRNPLLPHLKIYEQPIVVSSGQLQDLEMCQYVACLAVHIDKKCRKESIMVENGKKCIGCPVNTCETPNVCPTLDCKETRDLSADCKQMTMIEFNGLLCPGCPKNICGKPKCVKQDCLKLPDFVPRQCIKRVQTTQNGEILCSDCFENRCIRNENHLDYCAGAHCDPIPIYTRYNCIDFPVVSIGGRKCLGCPDDVCKRTGRVPTF